MNKEGLVLLLHSIASVMKDNREVLIEMDSIVGDGDLGLTMSDGFAAAAQAASDSSEQDLGKLLYMAGKAMANKVPSTMGTLMASGWMQAGKALRGKTDLSLEDVVKLFEAYTEGVAKLGQAKQGEKTVLDGLIPAVQAMREQPNLLAAAQAGLKGAQAGFEATQDMVAVHGRAATRAEASRTLPDPGAKVAVLMFEGFVQALN